ncbi:SH3 domain-containing protein [Aquibacillus saliphilus]|uniref:SH3 domain-containing protein n=1 Tax=Aquibacillus saliphilus TaxID=1909422 RepID=UPI001CF0A827|nr:SH3 domain-containing protein [Aquibacillus saliphilus]
MNKRKSFLIIGSLLIFIVAASSFGYIYNQSKAQTKVKTNQDSLITEVTETESDLIAKKSEDTATENTDDTIDEVDQEQSPDPQNKEDKPEKTAVKTLSTKYVSVSSLNVRAGPSTNYDVSGVVTLNQAIEAVEGSSPTEWVEVQTEKFTGFVNGKYLSDKKIELKSSSEKAASKNKKTTDNESKEKDESESTEKTDPPAKPKTNDADKLKTVSKNNQLILVTSNDYGTSSAKIQTFERNASGSWDRILSTSGHIGKKGFAKNKVEGDQKSPRGKYTIGTAFGRQGNPGTKLPFRNITADDVWVDDPQSQLYNT